MRIAEDVEGRPGIDQQASIAGLPEPGGLMEWRAGVETLLRSGRRPH